MHLLIPFAFCRSEGCAAALSTLRLPHLEKLLARLTAGPLDPGDEFSLSPPHERALARALGLDVEDGLLPWAALEQPDAGAWGYLTPCHWQVTNQHIIMRGVALPDFSARESQALLTAMQPYFAEDGLTLHYEQPTRWRVGGTLLDGLASASLDRVVGRDVTRWLPRGAGAVALQRLQSEMQMLLYTHPVNEARAERGVPPVNSFWLSGTGALPPPPPAATPAAPTVVGSLREAALNEDWRSWAQAWQTVDASQCATLLDALRQGQAGQLTLCGERHAQTFSPHAPRLFRRLMKLMNRQPASQQLQQL